VTAMSVLDRARALTAEANRLREGSVAEDNAKRVFTQADGLGSALEHLRRLLEAARALQAQGAEVPVGEVDEGRERFAQLAADGLPSVRAITAARQKVEGVLERVQATLAEAWQRWAGERLAELPIQRLAVLPAAAQRNQQTSYTELKRLGKIEVPHVREISSFVTTHAGLRESLSDLREPEPELEALLSRLGRKVSLDRVSDAEIAMLREYGLADQIELHRRGL